MPEIATRLENAGAGNPQIYYNIRSDSQEARKGAIFAVMREWDQRSSPAFIEELRARYANDPDADIVVRTFENGPPLEAPIAIRISGPDLATLKRIAADVTRLIEKTPGTRDINNPLAIDRVDLDLGVDDSKAALLGVGDGEIRRALRLALEGERAASFRDEEGDSYPVTVRLPMDERQPVSALDAIYVPTTAGAAVPLDQVATPFLSSVPPRIDRFLLERNVTVTGYTKAGFLTQRVTRDIVDQLPSIDLPPGYSFGIGGEADATSQSFDGIGGIALLAVFAVLAVLIMEFGNFREVSVVAGVIPLGMFGGLVALLLTGYPLSYMAIIGFVALIGIEIKNSILLVDFTTQLRQRGVPLREAIERAGEIRFLPVLLTSVTAIGGLLPLALGGSALYSPLAWIIIGGLVSSTFLSRIVTPVMYLLLVRSDTDTTEPVKPAVV
jgi:multidrug efflux pump subunit AcrB